MSLLAHTKLYSPYGIGFKKGLMFSKHGAPALYMRPDVFKKHMGEFKGFHQYVWSLITPFSPPPIVLHICRLRKHVTLLTKENGGYLMISRLITRM